MTESDMDQLVRYHDKCRETSKLARELGKVDVAEWIDLRIEEGEAQQAAKNKVTIYQNGNHNICLKYFSEQLIKINLVFACLTNDGVDFIILF